MFARTRAAEEVVVADAGVTQVDRKADELIDFGFCDEACLRTRRRRCLTDREFGGTRHRGGQIVEHPLFCGGTGRALLTVLAKAVDRAQRAADANDFTA